MAVTSPENTGRVMDRLGNGDTSPVSAAFERSPRSSFVDTRFVHLFDTIDLLVSCREELTFELCRSSLVKITNTPTSTTLAIGITLSVVSEEIPVRLETKTTMTPVMLVPGVGASKVPSRTVSSSFLKGLIAGEPSTPSTPETAPSFTIAVRSILSSTKDLPFVKFVG